MSDRLIDCLVIGAGPAGLAAAIYLGRFRHQFVVIDGGRSRARQIPLSHNFPGFPDGIRGTDLLTRMRLQASSFGCAVVTGFINKVEEASEGTFYASSEAEAFLTRTVLLATGVVDEQPPLPGLHSAIQHGLLRYCPVCDGFEAVDRRVGVLGRGATGLAEALFLRTYTPHIALLTLGQPMRFTPEESKQAREAGVRVIEDPIAGLTVTNDGIQAVTVGSTATYTFDVMYSALGCSPRSELARELGAAQDDQRCIVVDKHQRTSIDGLYAAGDVVQGLDQIAVAIGHATIAACAIHNRLRKRP
jgi:thioredoxin reductase (NADPH)